MKNVYRVVIVVLLIVLLILLSISAKQRFYSNPVMATQTISYTVKPGDSIWSIAKNVNSDRDIREIVYKIKQINGIKDSIIYPGQEICLPQ